MTKQFQETLNLLRAIRDGELQDADQIRSVLSEARMRISMRRGLMDKHEALYFAAEQAFLHGWAPEDERTEI